MYLLDSDALRALEGKSQSPQANKWAKEELDETDIHFSAIVIVEKRKGVEQKRKRGGKHATDAAQIEQTLEKIITFFRDRIFPVDTKVADEWGRLLGESEKNVNDRCIAATARIHGLIVVTRNTRHYKQCGVLVLDPSRPNPQAVLI
jgi:toxin FitB